MEIFRNLLTLQQIRGMETEGLLNLALDIEAKGECYTLKALSVNGEDLAEIGVPRGEAMGELLEKLLEYVIQNPGMNNKESLLKFIKNKK